MNAEENTGGRHPAQLRVSHPASNVMGRGLTLWLDGEELWALKAGKAVTVEIEPGAHSLRVSNTYHSKTVEFDATAGEQVRYVINNKVGLVGWFLLTMLGSGPMHLQIERAAPLESASLSLKPSTSS